MATRNDIIYAYMLFYKHYSGANLSGRRYGRKSWYSAEGEKNERIIDGILMRVVYLFKSNYLPINEITEKPMSEAAKEVYRNLLGRFNIFPKDKIDEYAEFMLRDSDKGFVMFGSEQR